VYTFDFSSFIFIPSGEIVDGDSMKIHDQSAYQYKLIFGDGCTIKYKDGTEIHPNVGDIYRWEKAWLSSIAANHTAKWVPAGLYHNGSNWENLNIADICNWYSAATYNKSGQYPKEYAFFAKPEYEKYRATSGYSNKYALQDGYSNFTGDSERDLLVYKECMAEAFQIAMYEYLDVADVSYHQAFIKLVAGTDNRAKNTYFQIVGPIYTNKTEINGKEVSLVSLTDGDKKGTVGYVDEGLFYPVTISNNTATTTGESYMLGDISTKNRYCINTNDGDYKIRLYADDLDTIFKTDNNGQQVKPYYLLEPPYNKDLESLWGDMHSGLFYNYDLKFVDDVKDKLKNLLTYSTGSQWPDEEGTKFNEYFFSVQKNIPSIAYNHQSEIYYESPQVLWQNGSATALYTALAKNISSWKDFNNNKVKNPVSLSHGSCLEAETEYLRDRVLMLSTYTNSAKKTTGTSIEFRSDSSGTEGDEFVLETDYTSFIQYLYPTLRSNFTVVASAPDAKTLQYDPLLDRMKYVSEEVYSPHYITSGITVPDGVVNMQETIATSSLTLTTYWTNTDLYRTVWIKSGSKAFNKPLNFPNANTVIAQDSSYRLIMPEAQPWNVVDNLRSAEHLVLQEAIISSSCLDFTGCNRLKTLVLGTTVDKYNDDDESYALQIEDVLNPGNYIKLNAANASTGFNTVILPKSHSLEQIILPSCVKVMNVGYYPNIKQFEFNSGTELENITIDGRNKGAILDYLLDSFIGSTTTTVEITNIPDNFWLSESVCRKLAYVPNVKMEGTINIGDIATETLATITWETKKLLVEKFGDIESGLIKFNYGKKTINLNNATVNTTGTIETSGPAPIHITMDGNDIPIDTNKTNLKVYYSIKDTAGNTPAKADIQFTDKYTPYLHIKEGLTGTYKITTTVHNTSTSKDFVTTITVGFYVPQIGDFAYGDGTFSSVFDKGRSLVGVVFHNAAINNSQGRELYDIRVLSAGTSSTELPLSPATYLLRNGYVVQTLEDAKKIQSFQKDFLSDLSYTDEYTSDVVQDPRTGGDATGVITYDKKWSDADTRLVSQVPLQHTTERDLQMQYIQRANNYIAKLSKYVTLGGNDFIETDAEVLTAEGKQRFDTILTKLKGLTEITVNGNTYKRTSCGSFILALYPAFLSALYYTPDKLSDKGLDYFGLGKWYVPDTREMERLIFYRINSAISNTTNTQDAWNSTAAATIPITGNANALFNSTVFDNIQFLKDTKMQVTSVSSDLGECYTYGKTESSAYPTPLWRNTVNTSYSSSPQFTGRDYNHNIYPVCRIELENKK
jgi:hypothetical protein